MALRFPTFTWADDGRPILGGLPMNNVRRVDMHKDMELPLDLAVVDVEMWVRLGSEPPLAEPLIYNQLVSEQPG